MRLSPDNSTINVYYDTLYHEVTMKINPFIPVLGIRQLAEKNINTDPTNRWTISMKVERINSVDISTIHNQNNTKFDQLTRKSIIYNTGAKTLEMKKKMEL